MHSVMPILHVTHSTLNVGAAPLPGFHVALPWLEQVGSSFCSIRCFPRLSSCLALWWTKPLPKLAPSNGTLASWTLLRVGRVIVLTLIPFGTFASEACRPLSKHVKSIQVLFDLHLGIPSCGDAAARSACGKWALWGSAWASPLLPFRLQFPELPKLTSFASVLGEIKWASWRSFTCRDQSAFKSQILFAAGRPSFRFSGQALGTSRRLSNSFYRSWGGTRFDGMFFKEKKRLRLPAVRPNGAHPIKNLKKGLASSMLTPQNATPETNKLCGSLWTSRPSLAPPLLGGQNQRYATWPRTKAKGWRGQSAWPSSLSPRSVSNRSSLSSCCPICIPCCSTSEWCCLVLPGSVKRPSWSSWPWP